MIPPNARFPSILFLWCERADLQSIGSTRSASESAYVHKILKLYITLVKER
jgi:hypothetical protein